jgi:hypothetical protein
MGLRSVTTMALACAASAAALAAAGPAPHAAASTGASGGAGRPVLVRPQSGASYEWGVATPVPGLATLDDNGTGQLSAVSCAAGGACSAGGFYTDGSTKLTQAFVVGESGGTWKAAQGLPSVATGLNTGGSAGIAAVSCAAAGNCGATGFFLSGGATHPFVVAESGGVWDGAAAVPGTGTDDSQSLAESCPVPQRCSIGGYVPAGSGRDIGFLDDQLPSHDWDAALPLPGTLGDLAPADSTAKVVSISCRSAGNCSAGGFYTDRNFHLQAFVVDERNGHWHAAQEVAAKLNVKGHAEITDVSCRSAGNCAAVGYYAPGVMQTRPFIVTSKNGVWGPPVAPAGITALDTGHASQLTAVSCGPAGAAGNCTAGGTYDRAKDASQQAFTVTEQNGKWGTARTVPGLGAWNTGRDATVAQVSCVSPGNCSAAGSFEEIGDIAQVWVASQHNGSWGVAGTVSELVNLNVGNLSDVTGLSCASVGSCGIVGYYYAGPDDQQPFAARGSIAVPTSAALTLSAPAVVDGREQSEKFSVTTKSANGLPSTGTVAIKAGAISVCTMTLSDGAGSCRPAASRLKPGTYSLVATLGPTQIYMGATSPAKILKVRK